MADKKTTKEKVANRLYLAADGSVTKEADEATGFRYELLGTTRKTEIPDVTAISPDGQRLLALFGAKTWIGNLYNQELDDDEIQARVDSVTKDGKWPEREGGGGPRYDADALAKAIASAKGVTDVAPFAKRIADEKGYGTMALKVPAVLDAYNKLTGKAAELASL